MSPDDQFLAVVSRALKAAGLEAILIGNAAAALRGAPVMTKDLDFFVRDTKLTRKKIEDVASRLGAGSVGRPYAPSSDMLRLYGTEVPVDFVFQISSHKRFESLRSRAQQVSIGGQKVLVASLDDVIAAKKAANRPRDRAVLKILEETLVTIRTSR